MTNHAATRPTHAAPRHATERTPHQSIAVRLGWTVDTYSTRLDTQDVTARRAARRGVTA